MPLQSLVEEPGVALHKVGVPADLREFVVFLNREGGTLRLLIAFKLRFGVHLIPHAREIFIVVVGGAGNTLLDHLERKRKLGLCGFNGPVVLGIHGRKSRVRVWPAHVLVIDNPPVLLRCRLRGIKPPRLVLRVYPELHHASFRIDIIRRQLCTVNLRDHPQGLTTGVCWRRSTHRYIRNAPKF